MKGKKKYLLLLGIIVCIGGIIGGYRMLTKETLTKRQQDNVVKRIARNYRIKKIEFINLEKNSFTGTYNLVFKVNNQKDTCLLQFEKLEEFNVSRGVVGLDPTEDYADIKKNDEFTVDTTVDISKIEIIYLKD
ncbi:hypothetical protein AB3331_08690 [Streptococcus sp. H49]|uniref:hypothetical protein n=1 Tax=Streptococcus huangxiaojuni TaxID=3237239 RepID=UPI0034A27486